VKLFNSGNLIREIISEKGAPYDTEAFAGLHNFFRIAGEGNNPLPGILSQKSGK